MDEGSLTKIFRMLKEAHVLTPAAYQDRQERRVRCALRENPCNFNGSPIAAILERIEYCRHTMNFKTHRQPYKIKKIIANLPEQWNIFRNTHEAIMDEDTFQWTQDVNIDLACIDFLPQAILPEIINYTAKAEQRDFRHAVLS